MAKIIQRRYFKSLVYEKEINGKTYEYVENFFDDKYVYMRKEEIEDGLYDGEYQFDPEMPVLDFIDIYLKKVYFKTYSKNAYENAVSIVKNYIMHYFKNKKMKDITKRTALLLDKKIEEQVCIGFNHKNENKTLIGYRTKGRIKTLLSNIFDYATEQGIYNRTFYN